MEILSADARRNIVFFGDLGLGVKPQFRFSSSTDADGNQQDALLIEDAAVFRSGHFYDSYGFEHTWEDIHIDQMVANFNLLMARGIFADVPVRRDHPSFLASRLDGLIGYTSALKAERRKNPVDGTEYTYLLATYSVIDPDAIQKISSGLWRNVSSEVGGWVSNNAAEFWPVFQGFAYVDIPAVEGLKGFNSHNGVGKSFSLMTDTKETPVTSPVNSPGVATPPGTTSAPATAPNPAASFQTSDPAAFARSQFTFTIGGQQTQDFSAVQTHITALETAIGEAREQSRKDFISSLAAGPAPKIMASQIENIEKFALGMDDERWKAFVDSWGAAEPNPTVSRHAAASATGSAATPAEGDAKDVLVATIQQHRFSGMSQEQIEKTKSFAKLKALDSNHAALTA